MTIEAVNDVWKLGCLLRIWELPPRSEGLDKLSEHAKYSRSREVAFLNLTKGSECEVLVSHW